LKVAFRVDAGVSIGAGHLSRCLTIASTLKNKGLADCFFILKSHEGDFASVVRSHGFEAKVLPLQCTPNYRSGIYKDWVGGNILDDANSSLKYIQSKGFESGDWMIVDHYGLDNEFEDLIAAEGIDIGIIDDLTNRHHNCKFLVDQTCGREDTEYKKWVSDETYLMTGERFCMLRPEFIGYRKKSLEKRAKFKNISNILINFGSTDPTNVTSRIIKSLDSICSKSGIKLIVVVGHNSPHLIEIERSVNHFSGEVELIIDAENMAKLMFDADIAIGAAGATTWERCALGLPTIIIKTADNQSTVIDRIIKFGVAELHDIDLLDQQGELQRHLSYILKNYQNISLKCSNLVTGEGTKEVVSTIIGDNIK